MTIATMHPTRPSAAPVSIKLDIITLAEVVAAAADFMTPVQSASPAHVTDTSVAPRGVAVSVIEGRRGLADEETDDDDEDEDDDWDDDDDEDDDEDDWDDDDDDDWDDDDDDDDDDWDDDDDDDDDWDDDDEDD